MKRSDMIAYIVYECLSWDGLETSGVPLEEIADDILAAIEKAGMLPPGINHNGDGESMDYEWEPEV